MLYLHEIIDIVGTGQQAYLQTVGERARHSEREGISRLMGTWKVIGSTNRWPRVVNLWEMDGWDAVGGDARAPVPARQDRRGAGAVVGEGDRVAQRRLRSHPRAGRVQPDARPVARRRPARLGVRAHDRATAARPARGVPRTPSARRCVRLLEARGLTLMGAYAVPMRSRRGGACSGRRRIFATCAASTARSARRRRPARMGRPMCCRWRASGRDDVAGAVARLLLPPAVSPTRSIARRRNRAWGPPTVLTAFEVCR